jgi:hypothetical protein
MAIFDKKKATETMDDTRERIANAIDPARSNRNVLRNKKNVLTIEEIKNSKKYFKNNLYLFLETTFTNIQF